MLPSTWVVLCASDRAMEIAAVDGDETHLSSPR